MRGRVAASLAIFAVLIVSLVATFAGADPIQVWNGDLDGSTNAMKIVTGAKGKPLPTSGSGSLAFDGGAWYFAPIVTPGTAGQALFTNDAGTATVWAYPHGDVDASATDPGALTVNAIQGFGVSTSIPSTGNALVYSSGLWRASPMNLAGGSASVTGTLPAANQAAQSLVGDVTGTTAANTVTGLTGSSGIVTAGAGSLLFNWSTSTAPLLQSGTAATSLTLGTDKVGATLALQADTAANVLQLAGGTQNGVALGANLATVGDMRVPSGFQWLARNAGNTANNTILNDDGANNITFGSGYGTITTIAAASYTVLSTGNIIMQSASDVYEDMSLLHLRTAAHSEVGQIVPGVAGTPNAMAIGASAGGVAITGAFSGTTRTQTAATLTIDTTTTDRIVYVDCTNNGITLTLPTPTNGRMLTVVDKANNCGNVAGGKQLTLARHSTEKLDGTAANVTTSTSGFRFNVWSDGTDWYTQNGTKFQTLAPIALFFLRRRRRAANDVADAFRRAA